MPWIRKKKFIPCRSQRIEKKISVIPSSLTILPIPTGGT